MDQSISRRRLLQASAAVAGTGLIHKESLASQGTSADSPDIEALVRMSPQPGSRFALPGTTIAFRDVSIDQIGNVHVVGSTSGPAAGVLREHSDGHGASWHHDAEFLEGELVTVSAAIPLGNSADGSVQFQIGERAPRPEASVTLDVESARDGDGLVHLFKSRPDLNPVQIDVGLKDETRLAPGLMAVTPHVPNGQAGALIVDNDGLPIWHHVPADNNHLIYCLQMQEYLGDPVLTWCEAASHVGWGYGHHVIANQNYEIIGYVQGGHGVNGLDVHDLILTDYGSAWVFSYDTVFTTMDGVRRNIMECVIQEIDVTTGDVWWEWHSLDHVALEESYAKPDADPMVSWDYIHINSIEVDTDGNLLVSSRTNHAIYKISVQNHQVLWRLGGKQSNFPLTEDAIFAWQHDARRREDGTLSIFDNHDDTNTVESRGMVFTIDEEAMEATLIQEFYRDGGMHSPYQANMQTLANGNVFMGWGSGPRCSEFTPEGEMIFDMRYRAGVSYRGYRIEWTGYPNTPIDYLLEDAQDGTATAWLSWNGATEVATWRVVAGAEAGSAVEVNSAPRQGFETAVAGIPLAAYMEAQALNAEGQILGGRILQRGA